MRILLVEDERHLAEAIAQVLKKSNYSVDLAHDGEYGLDCALSGIHDIIVLDIMLPELDGIGVLRELRSSGIMTPVILLTAKSETSDKVNGLDSGADDYLVKPFQTEELLARLRALCRRRGEPVQGDNLRIADIEFNPHRLILYGPDRSFRLTLKEGQLLELLLRNSRMILPATTIIERLWGYDAEKEDGHVQVYVSFLRKKLTLLGSVVRIRAVRGVGYVLAAGGGEAGDAPASSQ